MSYCDDCLHVRVCEIADDPETLSCDEKLTAINEKSLSQQEAEQTFKCAVCGCSQFDLK